MDVHWGLYCGGFVLNLIWHCGSGGSAGLLSYPLVTVRRWMMMQSGLKQPIYHSTLDCWRKIYRREGLASFYLGTVLNMFGSTGAAAVLVLYGEVNDFLGLE
ncbi:Mito_carr domain-containing protein [Cephalotus follicularis]|uniref:ADP/ATP translocase n=1 Tax=Cephalotus follicularis TaxID=3775 RepID=A0A1Q3DIN2_CEPFO|nr:Mito_carr domain-containing protein [Cephalotus follicularis]